MVVSVTQLPNTLSNGLFNGHMHAYMAMQRLIIPKPAVNHPWASILTISLSRLCGGQINNVQASYMEEQCCASNNCLGGTIGAATCRYLLSVRVSAVQTATLWWCDSFTTMTVKKKLR